MANASRRVTLTTANPAQDVFFTPFWGVQATPLSGSFS
jgi:hypothetical protein